ncbi:MAG: glycosyltransferase family 4 protein [Bacteroidia bacterium]|nr:glycosyltransferase family 4 protein [Bacteroidia bacterium]
MKIGFEAQRIFRKKKHGMDMVALELIRNLQKIDSVNEYYVFVKPDEDNKIIQPSPNFHVIEIPGGPYPYWEQILLPQAARKYGCQILHCTSNTAPIFTNIPLILTLHDIIFMESSLVGLLTGEGSNYQRFGNVYRQLIVPGLMRNCKKIITVSDYENKRIGDFFNLPQNSNLTTVYNGVSEHFRVIESPIELQKIKDKYKLPDFFFFFLGNTHPKKNTIGVLKAYSEFLKTSQQFQYKLVMIDYDLEELKRLLNSIDDPELINQIQLTGYINNQDLPAIYNQCSLFLYPSLRESFGIPIIEAMACGVPVITSNTSSMPEVAGDAAILIDPIKPESITQAILSVYQNESLKKNLVEKGLIQASKFSWKSMAEQVRSLYLENA